MQQHNEDHTEEECIMSGENRKYYLFDIHEIICDLEFVTHVPYVINHDEDVHEKACSYLLDWYGEGNGVETDEYGKYTVDFNNGSFGFVSYREIKKEEFDVITKFI
jgi:hypothetical protein